MDLVPGLDVDGVAKTSRQSFEFVPENRRRHLEHADDVRPIVRRRDLNPMGELSAANPDEIAQRLRARGACPIDGRDRGRLLGCLMPVVFRFRRGAAATRPRSLISCENPYLRFWRGGPRGLQESGLVIIEPGIARGLLGLFGKGGDGLRATDFLSGDAEVAGRKAIAAFMAMTATVFPLAFNLRNLPRLNVTFLRREFRVLSHLLGALADRQFGAEQVLGDSPHARLNIVEVDEPYEDALGVKHFQCFDPVPAGDEDEAALALNHGRRALQADRSDGPRQLHDGRRVVRARCRGNFYRLSRRVRPFEDRLIGVVVIAAMAFIGTSSFGGYGVGWGAGDDCQSRSNRLVGIRGVRCSPRRALVEDSEAHDIPPRCLVEHIDASAADQVGAVDGSTMASGAGFLGAAMPTLAGWRGLDWLNSAQRTAGDGGAGGCVRRGVGASSAFSGG